MSGSAKCSYLISKLTQCAWKITPFRNINNLRWVVLQSFLILREFTPKIVWDNSLFIFISAFCSGLIFKCFWATWIIHIEQDYHIRLLQEILGHIPSNQENCSSYEMLDVTSKSEENLMNRSNNWKESYKNAYFC
jgi:hypothetical protein